MNFVKENFSEQEEAILNQYFTNIDKPVFGLINLPDVVKGALFARYSRSNKSLRRLFLDEFYDNTIDQVKNIDINQGTNRASSLYDKMILDFGDDSVAQLGGAHIACEQVSNLLTKILEKGRIASYLEQSTRYVYYNEKSEGKYNYSIPLEIRATELESEYCQYVDSLFDTYSEILNELSPALKVKYPKQANQSDRAWEATIRAKSCDILRGLLPAATKSNMGIYASGQSYEYLLIKMYASRNSEVLQFADMILEELRKIIPSFLTRVDLEDRGRLWSRYIQDINQNLSVRADDIFHTTPNNALPSREINETSLISWNINALDCVVEAILFESSQQSQKNISTVIGEMPDIDKVSIINDYCGNRLNRRHKPGRAFEAVSYKFEILSDYGAFRDLQRHRMLTIQWQKLSPHNGYIMPIELKEFPKLEYKYEKAIIAAKNIYEKIERNVNSDIAQYVVPFAYRLRYDITMNLREAFHFIELRSQKQGHHSYRKISIDMYNAISNLEGHSCFTDNMQFVDRNDYELSREDAENKKDNKQV